MKNVIQRYACLNMKKGQLNVSTASLSSLKKSKKCSIWKTAPHQVFNSVSKSKVWHKSPLHGRPLADEGEDEGPEVHHQTNKEVHDQETVKLLPQRCLPTLVPFLLGTCLFGSVQYKLITECYLFTVNIISYE